MNTNRIRRSAIAIAAAAVLPFSMIACSSDSDDSTDESTAAAEQDPTPGDDADSDEGDSADEGNESEPFGAGCAAVPDSGDGSFEGMAEDPVATAAGNNPALSTLVKAVEAAELGDTLNSAKDITVFAPANDAFDKIPEKDLNDLLKDKEALSEVLTYHVVDERLTPKDLEDGTYETLAEEELTVSGADEEYEVNDESKVICGNVQTANATVYIVDTVLMPKK